MTDKLNFSKSDCDTILFALSLFPEYQSEFANSQAQADINLHLCLSAIDKVLHQNGALSLNELRIISGSLILVRELAAGNVPAKGSDKIECSKRFFTVNALLSKLSSLSV